MGDLLNFKIYDLDKVLKKYGLRKSWINILATHLQNKKKFEYILNSKEFSGANFLTVNLIEDLTIGEIGVLYEYSVAKFDTKSRKSNGQFFTPDDVAEFMVQNSKEFGNGIWLDPCCGIGNLSWHLVAAQEDPEKFLENNLLLSDKDELALFIARVLLTVSFQEKNKNLFTTTKNNFICFDFLSVSDNNIQDLFKSNSFLDQIPTHDFVIVNPPYLAIKADSRFETSESGDLYSYFLENIIKTSIGFISITPQSFTNAKKFKSLRKLLINSFNNITIYTFDNVPANIFKGIKFGSQNTNDANSIRAAITIAKKGRKRHQITSLVRWRSSERNLMFKKVHKILSEIDFSDEYFPKISNDFKDLYFQAIGYEKLSNLISKSKTKYSLYIPSSPRYFITGLKKPVDRSSQKHIYFKSELDRDRAYLLINSSYMYWWWRVRDGGMTLSLDTILSLPVPKFKLNKNLILELEKSERKNRVYKKNAGAIQENVKHPKTLIKKINKIIAPEFTDLLIGLHENSEISKFNKK